MSKENVLKLPVRFLLYLSLSLVFVACVAVAWAQGERPAYLDARLAVDVRVRDLLGRMTLEEKVAQLTCLWARKPQERDEPGNYSFPDRGGFSAEKARLVMPHGIGEIARQREVKDARASAEYANAVQHWLAENTRLPIPVIFHDEALHGHMARGSTVFPVPLALAASWDTELVSRVFTAAALETRARRRAGLGPEPRPCARAALESHRRAEAVEAAKASDAVVLVIGGNEDTNREAWAENHLGDRDSLELVGRQNELVRAVLATKKPTAVFLINGGPLSINYVAENTPAILEGFYLGEETGTAAADVLFGDYNPAGKLPVTFPRSVGQLPVYYNRKPSAKRGYLFTTTEPLYPFGYGLSYTTFTYTDLRVSPARIRVDGEATISLSVTNKGLRRGDEIVQLYIRDDVSSVTRPVKELKDFARVALEPGETRQVSFRVTPDKLWFYDRRMRRVIEPGTFHLMVGASSVDFKTVQLEVVDR